MAQEKRIKGELEVMRHNLESDSQDVVTMKHLVNMLQDQNL